MCPRRVFSLQGLTVGQLVLLAAQPLAELLAVPHQQLLFGLHGPHGVEVDVPAVLARHRVLLRRGACRVHVTHPVALVDVVAINEVLQLAAAVDLQKKKVLFFKTAYLVPFS